MMELKTVAIRSDGAFGVLLWDTRPFAVTVERTFDDLSTILHGLTYKCRHDFYHKGNYETFEIVVPGHDRVLFHRGNREIDSVACVCVAESFTRLDGYTAIGDSAHGFAEFMSVTAGLDEFDLIVTGRP
jgi:hypothetical protein